MEEHHIHSLIVRYLSKETSPDEESELLDWLAKDPSNQHAFREWQQVWRSDAISESSFDLGRGLVRLNKAIDSSPDISTGFHWRKLAASLAIFITAGLAVYFIGTASSPFNPESIVYQTETTGLGETAEFLLGDGSSITLNANSSLRYPRQFSFGKREVYLEGEAFFQVSKDATRPFIIHSGDVNTHVLGTSFNINSNDHFVTVSVATGKVKVVSGDMEQIIFQDEKIIYRVKSKQMIKTAANLEHDLAWKNNTMLFEDSRLLDVAVKLKQFYGVSVAFEDELLKKCLFTGKFTGQPLETILKAVSFSTGVKYRVIDKKITLYGPGCE